jgi:hypothetical protein
MDVRERHVARGAQAGSAQGDSNLRTGMANGASDDQTTLEIDSEPDQLSAEEVVAERWRTRCSAQEPELIRCA